MKKFKLFGLVALFIFSACQKDASDALVQKEMTDPESSEVSARFGSDFWDHDERDLIFYALGEGNKLDKFRSDDSDELLNSAIITGLQQDEKIMAIDFRPATGQLYGLGSTSRIYVINPQTGIALAIGTGPFTPALSGTIAGFDFNPTVDRIRIVTNTGQNLRLNPETGVIAATDLPINAVTNAMVTSVAYDNNFAGAATTTLFDIDVTTDKLYRQNPPNNGTLEEIGSLQYNFEGEGGFDIAPPDVSNYFQTSYKALAIYQVNKKSALFSIDLVTGKARKIEKFNRSLKYYGIAIPTKAVAYAVSGNNFLIFNPNKISGVVTKPIAGLQAGETLQGIDFRPVNGQMYGLGSNSGIYTINASSGLATFVAALSVPLNGTSFGIDFNPVVDRIRIVSNTGQNLRVNPADGAATTDMSLNPGAPAVSAAAYANNFAGTAATTLYVIDASTDKLYIQNPPNDGTLTEVGRLNINIDASNGFDISGNSNRAFGIFTNGNTTRIYRVDLLTGRARFRNSFPGSVTGFTIGLGF